MYLEPWSNLWTGSRIGWFVSRICGCVDSEKYNIQPFPIKGWVHTFTNYVVPKHNTQDPRLRDMVLITKEQNTIYMNSQNIWKS